MSEYKWGDKVWVWADLEGVVIGVSKTKLHFPYLVATKNEDEPDWCSSDALTPRIDETVQPQSDPIESAVAAMASEPTSKPSEPEPTPTAESDLGLAKHVLETAYRLLTHAALDDHKVLGDKFARDAIRAALPLIKAACDLAG